MQIMAVRLAACKFTRRMHSHTISAAVGIHCSCHYTSPNPRSMVQRTVSNKLLTALDSYEELNFSPLKFYSCEFGTRFSQASIEFSEYYNKEYNLGYILKFSDIFGNAFDYLKKHIDSDGLDILKTYDDEFTLQAHQRFQAVMTLFWFLCDIEHHEECLMRHGGSAFEGRKDSEVATLLTNHLLCRLVYGNKYIINNNYHIKHPKCPCLKMRRGCSDHINYGQTGLGHEEIWYGYPDIFLFPSQKSAEVIPVQVLEEADDGELEIEDSDADIFEGSGNYFKKYADQVLSQALTSALCHANICYAKELDARRTLNCQTTLKPSSTVNPSPLLDPQTTLIPSLFLTPNHYYVVMYDFENDVLLSSEGENSLLWNECEPKFSLSSVLQIWMVLNHSAFHPSLDHVDLKCLSKSSNFHRILQNQNLYEKTKLIFPKLTFSPRNCSHKKPNFMKMYIKHHEQFIKQFLKSSGDTM